MFLPHFISWLSSLNEMRLFFNTWFPTSKMISDFYFIVFQKSLIIKFTAVFRFYSKIRCHSNKCWHWILLVWIRRCRFIKAQYITRSLATKWNHCHITTMGKIRRSCSLLCLLHLPRVMMLIICFYVLVHENVIATVDFNLEFGLLIVLDLFSNSFVWPDIAETTAITSLPASNSLLIILATWRILSIVPTEVPPNFNTFFAIVRF